mmetsp:Transcript_26319/g.63844  ORF Transcript_26319/g.63844 Transcript_26319/m.63844 type:complete len:221 (+) Transcript_26319:7188-7850(+)
MDSACLCIAVDRRDLDALHLHREGMSQQHTFAAPLGTDQQKGLIVLEPRPDEVKILEEVDRLDYGQVPFGGRIHHHVLGGQLNSQICLVVNQTLLTGAKVAVERFAWLQRALVAPLENLRRKFCTLFKVQVAAHTSRESTSKLLLHLATNKVRQSIEHQADLGRLDNVRYSKHPLKSLVERQVEPRGEALHQRLRLPAHPSAHQTASLHVLVTQKDHSHA